MMYFDRLSLFDYRNYEKMDVTFYRGLNLLYGDNAQGKTNLLEALFLFAAGKSHRAAKDRELIRFEKERAHVIAQFFAHKREMQGDIFLFQEQKKKVRINEIEITKSADLMGYINVVFFGPEHIHLIQDGPSQRRRFLDLSISQLRPNYCMALSLYQRVLQHRNKLIKNHKKPCNYTVLEVFDEKLAALGADIILHRVLYLEKLSKIAAKIHGFLTNGEDLGIQYKAGIPYQEGFTKKEVKQKLKEALEKSYESDIQCGFTTKGPHRDDITLTLNDKDVKFFGSQGQKRTVVISLKLSEIEFIKNDRNEFPVVLLDDIMSELDEKRQSYLLEFVKDKQVFLTDTDGAKANLTQNCAVYQVKNGHISLR